MKSQFSKRSSLKRIAIWFVIQTPIVLYTLTAASLSVRFHKPTNPFSSESVRFMQYRAQPYHDAIGFVIFGLIVFALVYFFAAWETKKKNIGVSGYFSFFLASIFFGLPTISVTQLLARDVLHHMGAVDSRDFGVPLLDRFATGELPGIILGSASILLLAVCLTWRKTKHSAAQRMCTLAGLTAVFYLCFGLARIALIEIKPEWVDLTYQQHYDLIGTGIALLSVAIGLRWALGAVFANRRMKCANLCESCGYDFTGLKERCPECGSPITPQTS